MKPGALFSHMLTAVIGCGIGVLLAQIDPACPVPDESRPAAFVRPIDTEPERLLIPETQQYVCQHQLMTGRMLGKECA